MRNSLILRLLALALVLTLLGTPALALHDGVRAQGRGDIPFRTGPGRNYAALYTLPQSTRVVAIEQEYGDGETWAFCEFNYNGSRVRAYTELSNLIPEGGVPSASHYSLRKSLGYGVEVNAAPDVYSDVIGYASNGDFTFLDYEGDFCLVEFSDGGQLKRGYLLQDYFCVSDQDLPDDFPACNQDTMYVIYSYCPMYAAPSENSEVLFTLPYDATVAVNFDELDYEQQWCPIYYGGLKGYVDAYAVTDLRGFDPRLYD